MDSLLTTTDNPYSPFTQYSEWEAFDFGKGHYTNQYLARILGPVTPFTTEGDIDAAIDTVLAIPPTGVYERVYPRDYAKDAERRKRFRK